jgi:serine protease AprX
MTRRIVRFAQTAILVSALVPAVAQAQTAPAPKLDESLRQALESGCTGTKPVIIRTKPGYRQAVRDALIAGGATVDGEFPALDAIIARVSCASLSGVADLTSTNSVSANAPVGAQSLVSTLTSTTSSAGSTTAVTSAQAAVAAAQTELVNAKTIATNAQQAIRTAEAVLSAAQAQVASAQKSVRNANKLTGAAKTTALAAAQAELAAALSQLSAAQTQILAAKAAATVAQTGAMNAQRNLVSADQALANLVSGASQLAAREAEGRAASRLKRKFFATMPVKGDWQQQAVEDADTDALAGSAWLNTVLGGYTSSSGGQSIGVAVVDSGIEAGIDFDSRLTAFYDFTQGDIRATAPNDGYGHGTHVAGLIASRFVGVATNARLIGLKVLDAQGEGTTANVVRAVEFAITNKSLLGIDVLNLSLGHPIYESAATDPLVQAVEHASRAGIAVFISAGNFGINPTTGQSGYAGIASPANAPSGIAVGAVRTFNTVTRDDDRIAPYSSRGPSWYDGFAKPDLSAPGDNLLSVAAAGSTLRIAQEQRGNTGNYMRLSGTSMAAAVASGVAALVLDANHGLTPNALKAVMEYTAIPVHDDSGAAYDALTQGAGDVEVAGAVVLARAINPTAPMGSKWVTADITPSTTIGSTSYAWSQSVIWGNHKARGADIISEQRPAWALLIVWGEGLDDSDNIVWGNNFTEDDNIVWGNLFDEGDNIVWGNNIVWADSLEEDDNIVWGNSLEEDDNIVWGNSVVWGAPLIGMAVNGLNLWSDLDGDNIVWGNLAAANVVWGNLFDDDNIVWGNGLLDDDNIVWGNTTELGVVMKWSGGIVTGKATDSRARRRYVRTGGVN